MMFLIYVVEAVLSALVLLLLFRLVSLARQEMNDKGSLQLEVLPARGKHRLTAEPAEPTAAERTLMDHLEHFTRSAKSPRSAKQTLPASPRHSAITHCQLFWSSQNLELRLRGLKESILGHKDLSRHVEQYVTAAAHAIADYFQQNAEDRDKLENYLLAKLPATKEHYFEWLDTDKARSAPSEAESYKVGYQAARHWVRTRKVPAEYSLYSSLSNWGIVT